MTLVDAIKAAIGQRQATVEQARQQAESEFYKILARCNKPRAGDDKVLLELAEQLAIEPERLAVMVETVERAFDLLATGNDAKLRATALAAVDAWQSLCDFDDETKRLVVERETKKKPLEDKRCDALTAFNESEGARKALRELASGDDSDLLARVGFDVEGLQKAVCAYGDALTERKGKP